MEKRLLKIQEVACLLGCSVATINHWYAFKKLKPDNEYSQILPEYIQDGNRQCRYWKQEDMWKLVEFKQKLPQGRNGILGIVTQKYTKKNKKEK